MNKGKFAEYISYLILVLKGYNIIRHNFISKYGEIDIIAIKGSTIIAVEVKYRASKVNLFFTISERQKQRISNSLQYFCSKYNYKSYNIRFDAIFVSKFYIKHLKNAW